MPEHELKAHSHVFENMFSMPPNSEDGAVEGTSDDKPIHLEGVKKEAFKLLLKLLYPL